MIAPIPFDPHRFRAAAAHYLEGRAPYPEALIARVALLSGLRPTDRVLDLGCGPGQLAGAFAPRSAAVVGVDPEPEMLRIAAASGVANAIWVAGSSYDIGPQLGRFRLVVIGRAFHWMDRPDTLRRLDAMVEPDGAVALFGDEHPAVSENAWQAPWRAVLDRFTHPGSARAWRRSPDWVAHESVLLESAFARLERIGVIERRRIAAETLIQRALSMSSTSCTALGEQVQAMAADLRLAIAPFVRDGTIAEVVEASALIARRAG
jgi:SAM-dependent methyltransferase